MYMYYIHHTILLFTSTERYSDKRPVISFCTEIVITTQTTMGEEQKFRNFRITGIVSAPFTPFKPDGEVNYDVFGDYVKYLTEHHFQHAFVNGTLAEGLSMTVEERKKVLEAWVKASNNKIGIIAHVGAMNLKDSQELARHAQEIGVEAIAAMAPSFYKPENEEVCVEYISQVAAAAPKVPFYYYCINFVTGIYLNSAKILSLAKDKIPNLCGLKHSSRELTSAHNCAMVEDGRFQVMIGSDVQFLTCLSLGIEVPVIASYVGDLFYSLKAAYDQGDMKTAREYQDKAQIITNIRAKYGGGMDVAKAIFKIVSNINVGPLRLPNKELASEKYDLLKKDLDETGFWK